MIMAMTLARLRINLGAVAHNVRTIQGLLAPGAELMAVVKADGFNHGATRVARVALANGAARLGVATFEEALELRREGIEAPILAWLWSTHDEATVLRVIAAGIDIGVTSLEQAEFLAALMKAQPEGTTVRVSVKVDTGIHRSAMPVEDLGPALVVLREAPGVEISGLFSHLACADDPDNPETDAQAERFRAAIESGRRLGLELPLNHICNSAATLSRKDLHFDMVRPGLAIYGHEPILGHENDLIPAMTWESDITVVHPIKAGEGSSYSLTWRAPKDGYIAIVPMGYADGLPRNIQGHLEVGINGHLYPQVGRVCMDQIVVDLGDNPHNVSTQDVAVIFGEGGLDATTLATRMGSISHEIICRPKGPRIQRIYETAMPGASAVGDA